MIAKQKIQICFCIVALSISGIFLAGKAPTFLTEEIPSQINTLRSRDLKTVVKRDIPEFITRMTPDALARKGELEGQIFIVTAGARNIPLGGVLVKLYDYNSARKSVPSYVEAGTSAQALSRLTEYLEATITDADGRFKFRVRRDSRYAICAVASRSIFQTVEEYHWLVDGDLNGKDHRILILSNENLSTTGSSDSLIFDPKDT